MAIYTIGHSTHSLEDFLNIIKSYEITALVDVRSVPRSRHTPQFNRESLPDILKDQGIAYHHIAKLGGLRHSKKDSINTGWHNSSFRGYADYMQTDDFLDGINQLLEITKNQTVAIMCAEAVPWRCHRSMIGDALIVRGIKVIDIFDAKKSQEEKLTNFSKVRGIKISYPPEE